MPYKSAAQRGLFHAKEARGEISPKVVKEFDEASKGKKLPEHVKKSPNYADGDMGTPPRPTWDQRRDAGFEKSSKK